MNINQQTQTGYTALFYAAAYGHTEVVAWIRAAGSDSTETEAETEPDEADDEDMDPDPSV